MIDDEDEDLEGDLVILTWPSFVLEEVNGNCLGGFIEIGEDSGDDDNEEAGEEGQLSVSSPESSEDEKELVDSIILCKDSKYAEIISAASADDSCPRTQHRIVHKTPTHFRQIPMDIFS